jgi:hypothetical protein
MKTVLLFLLVAVTTACGQAPGQPGQAVNALSVEAPVNSDPVGNDPIASNPVPIPAPSPTPSASPVPAIIVHFIYQNSAGICDAVRNWNPATTTLVFPTNGAGTFIYTFKADGITISNADGSNAGLLTGTITKDGPANNPPTCVITVNMGQLASIQ